MFSLFKPDANAADRFLRQQASLSPTYQRVGSTAAWGRSPQPPPGFRIDVARVVLGTGRETCLAAVDALRRWRQFDVGWADVHPADAPPEPGRVVAVRARVAGLWTMHACRILYVIDEDAPVRRFGFGYGTLPGHAESGEERFLVEWDRADDSVSYEVAAFVRPRHPLARLAAPYAKRLADRFRRDSAAAMRRAVAS